MINQTTTEKENHNTINPTNNQDNALNATIAAKNVFSNNNSNKKRNTITIKRKSTNIRNRK